ncbi:hypothetical protein ABZ896_10710 [Streptomyces sp. NPDC047072]|uniref:hypothetical protein n=1 Tax=Streptomyces sp. NPDC047072 TaxID=3154809 RepID=UPI003410179F
MDATYETAVRDSLTAPRVGTRQVADLDELLQSLIDELSDPEPATGCTRLRLVRP